MARKAFAGDFIDALPKGRIEPYRLWFEFLKFALQTKPRDVDQAFYSHWGDVHISDFDQWWRDHWKLLFAIPASVTLVTKSDEAAETFSDPDALLIRINRKSSRTQQVADVKKLLDMQFGRGNSRAIVKPPFDITAKRHVHYPALRGMLKFLQLYEKHLSIEAATLEYQAWAENWNAKIGPQSKRSKIAILKTVQRFSSEISNDEEERKARRGKVKQSRKYNDARSDMLRFLKSGQKVVRNVCSGVFPGTY